MCYYPYLGWWECQHKDYDSPECSCACTPQPCPKAHNGMLGSCGQITFHCISTSTRAHWGEQPRAQNQEHDQHDRKSGAVSKYGRYCERCRKQSPDQPSLGWMTDHGFRELRENLNILGVSQNDDGIKEMEKIEETVRLDVAKDQEEHGPYNTCYNITSREYSASQLKAFEIMNRKNNKKEISSDNFTEKHKGQAPDILCRYSNGYGFRTT